ASPDGRYLAYALAQGGADWRTVHVRDLASHADLTDTLRWVRFSDLSWTRDGQAFSTRAIRNRLLAERYPRRFRGTPSTTTEWAHPRRTIVRYSAAASWPATSWDAT